MERASLRQAFISVFVLKSSRLSVFARDPGLGNSFTLRREGAKRTDTSKDRISVSNLSALASLRDTSAMQSQQESFTPRREDAKRQTRQMIGFKSFRLSVEKRALVESPISLAQGERGGEETPRHKQR